MTDQLTQPPPDPVSAPTGASPHYQAPPVQLHPQKSYGLAFFVVWLVLLLLVAALCFGGFLLWRQLDTQQQTIGDLRDQLEQSALTLETKQQVLEDDIEKELVEQQQEIQARLNDMAEQLDSNNARLLSLSSVNRDEWKLQEAQYLLRLADQRILLEKDSQNALALALSADDVLRDIDQADLVGVRKLLAEEIAVLKLAGVIDREGIFLRLSALSTQVDAIPFIEPLGQEQSLIENETVPEEETLKQKIARNFYSLLNKLGSYVRVRDHGQTINAVLPPDEQKFLQQNLRLMLEQAQVALLRNDKGIYQESLVKAQNWINQYYNLNEQAKVVLEELQALQQENISPELTNFSNSSAALSEYIERREKMAAARRGGRS